MTGRKLIGLLLVLFGVGFFLQQADVIDFEQLLRTWWPVIIIVVGIIQLTYRTYSGAVSGVLFIIVGGFLLIGQFVSINMWEYIWPLIFIVAGASFLFSRARGQSPLNDEEHIRVMALFSGSNVKSHTSSFQGGTVITIFGGAEIDLRKAVIVDGAVIDMTSVFGGATLFVPDNTKLDIKGVPIFGGWEDKTAYRPSGLGEENDPVLRVNCHPLFGGIEVKN